MSSGIGLSSDAISLFEEMKLRQKYNWIIYQIKNETIQPVQLSAPNASIKSTEQSYNECISHMPEDEGRFAVFDLQYDNGLEGQRSKLIFIMWCPDTSKIKSRMLYASSKAALRTRMDGIHTEIQCTDISELAFDEIFAKVAPSQAKPVVYEE